MEDLSLDRLDRVMPSERAPIGSEGLTFSKCWSRSRAATVWTLSVMLSTSPQNGNDGNSFHTFVLTSPPVEGGFDVFNVKIEASEGGAPLGGNYSTLKPPATYGDDARDYDPGDGDDAYSPCSSPVQLAGDTQPDPGLSLTDPNGAVLTAAWLIRVTWHGQPAQAGPTLSEDVGA